MSSVQTAKNLVAQLQTESGVERMPVSQTTKDIISYISAHSAEDHLIHGIDKKSNPFQEKSSCTVL